MRFVLHIATIAIGVGVAACVTNRSGNLHATDLGDTSHPAQRGSPIDALRTACGSGASLAGAPIWRQPYLQQVTSRSAIIGWVTTEPDAEHVEVTHPDGTLVARVAAENDSTALHPAGGSQMWGHVEGLEPDTVYCYTLVNGDPMTEKTGFRTAPTRDAEAPVRFLAFGDSGFGGSDQRALLGPMMQFPYDLMIHTGDIAYDSGTLVEFEANVFGIYAELFRNLAFFPAAGNHEYQSSAAGPFRSVFALPDANREQWYSYDWGRVHFAALDTEADYATQAAWLDDDLAATSLPWKIVYMHRPPYSSGEHGSDTGLRAKLAPVFEKHRVQLVLAGHDHDYERTDPQNGTVYVVTGGGGRGTRPVGSSSFTAHATEVIHFVYAEVGVDQLVLHAVDATGNEFDSTVVAR